MEYNHHICPFKVSFSHTFNTQNKLSYSIHPEATVTFHLLKNKPSFVVMDS